jgi:hypothetical protein
MTTTDTTAAELAARHLELQRREGDQHKAASSRYRSRQPASAGRANGVGPYSGHARRRGQARPGVRSGRETVQQRSGRRGWGRCHPGRRP